jgi:hypothetical protein
MEARGRVGYQNTKALIIIIVDLASNQYQFELCLKRVYFSIRVN